MARKDIATKKYMRNPRRFADFFNGFIYGGKQVIDWSTLEEVDSSMLSVIPASNGKTKSNQKIRDIIKKVVVMRNEHCYYALLGIENQTDIHYAMPVRDMVYDSLAYLKQVEEMADYNRNEGKCSTIDFLSGFTKSDRLMPVITVTLYWGAKPWDAPTSLSEMLIEVDSELAKYINDYDINLFSIIDAEGFPDYKTELRELFLLLNTRNDKTKMTRLIQSDAEFSHINQETAELMREFASLKLPRKSKDGEYDMCKAVEDMKKESEAKGVDLVSDVFARLVAGESKESILESGVAVEIIDKAESMIKMVKP
ncbi:Rpn family recombination-promoting nuclease/putative transposase [Pseudobutyrivibrio xylanivorans]|uniref:Putative transposase, YhgA-like n=1 Tax=Pseudobutyrivibrio xylanivorans DSM 14809 TaxID=1123012 RepID=A0A1M6E203_PSEXY|nr:Rpn family recombination-promoting nuclease/putative transposase [Pseudobutyrivibrio xylanivorans]SHI79532.1 Putative transposase, YhgA-like [Pseudobutyrivibrio xylanivorans DSM 14809]